MKKKLAAIGAGLIASAAVIAGAPAASATWCNDGSWSNSVGRGTCSWHGGIDRSRGYDGDRYGSSYKWNSGSKSDRYGSSYKWNSGSKSNRYGNDLYGSNLRGSSLYGNDLYGSSLSDPYGW